MVASTWSLLGQLLAPGFLPSVSFLLPAFISLAESQAQGFEAAWPSRLCCRPLSGCCWACFVWVHPQDRFIPTTQSSTGDTQSQPTWICHRGQPSCQSLVSALPGSPHVAGGLLCASPLLLQVFFSCKLNFVEYFC